eukprot:CAMPEP_0183344610 /NCGR_PEP_ID=MMETSP0164_2-20130417/10243_1 /TAXON_ID=221442 /ORGANISM="Coccolithus pelagicus ssp braarudi, Strain PLY182g" /LENGTH=42 /DNA_ID= /DNA_START= /DNA_END= /DNA_ORIENTATION=
MRMRAYTLEIRSLAATKMIGCNHLLWEAATTPVARHSGLRQV